MKAIIITAIICFTLIAICWIDKQKGNKKGDDKHDQ